MSVAMRSLWVMTTGVIPSTTIFSGRRKKKRNRRRANYFIKVCWGKQFNPALKYDYAPAICCWQRRQHMYVPVWRVNQRVNLHFLFVVRNRSLSVNVVSKTADENPPGDAKITICHQQSVSFHRVPCSFKNLALYMYTCAGKVSSFFLSQSR